jgi:hypothetical protein
MFELEAIKEQLAALQSQIACILSGDCCSGGEVPNDAWIPLDNEGMTLITPAATATLNAITVNLLYKIIAEDTVIIKGYVRLDVTTTALDNTINLNMRWPAFSGSNWFTGSKIMTGALQRNPITIVNITNPLVETLYK